MSSIFWKPGTKEPATNSSSSNKSTNEDIQHIEGSSDKRQLSKSVMGMKFMKQVDISQISSDASVLKASLDWNIENKNKIEELNVCNSDLTSCINEDFNFSSALPGRRSFNGCNKAIERHYDNQLDDLKYYNNNKIKVKVMEDKTNMTEDMIKMYEGLVGLPRGPNQGQRIFENKNIKHSNSNNRSERNNKKRIKHDR